MGHYCRPKVQELNLVSAPFLCPHRGEVIGTIDEPAGKPKCLSIRKLLMRVYGEKDDLSGTKSHILFF